MAVVSSVYTCAAHQIAINNANIMWVSHLDFQEVTPGYYQGFIQPAAGNYFNTTAMWSDPGLLVRQISPLL